MTLVFTPAVDIPSGGLITLVFPTEVTGTPSGCTLNDQSTTATLTYSVDSTNPTTLSITNAFGSAYTNPGPVLTLKCNGLTNPAFTGTIDTSFKLYINDASNSLIAKKDTGLKLSLT